MNDNKVSQKILRFVDKYIWVFHVCTFTLFLYLGIKELVGMHQNPSVDKRTHHTNYRATINDDVIVCDVVEHSKLGYNMTKCENGRQYFNVTNIEMVAGEK